MDACEITILNWEKYQGEAKKWDHPTWFRFSNELCEHIIWDITSGDEFKAMYALIAEISRKAHLTGKRVIIPAQLARNRNLPLPAILSIIRKLASNLVGFISLREVSATELGYTAHSDFTPSGFGVDTCTLSGSDSGECLTDVTLRLRNNKNCSKLLNSGAEDTVLDFEHVPKKPRFDFDSLYELYPLKRGKQRGMAKAHAQIKTQADYDSLARAIRHYAFEYLRPIDPNKEFRPNPQHFSTFMGGSWRDWIEGKPEGPAVTVISAPSSLPPAPAGIPAAEIERNRKVQEENASIPKPDPQAIERVKGLVQQITGIPR